MKKALSRAEPKSKVKARPKSRQKPARNKAIKDIENAVKRRAQYAALPYRVFPRLEFLLVTTRERRRWVAPKGWPMVGRSRRAAAGREAFEEAGVIGKVGREPLGIYDYDKVLPGGEAQRCRVTVFAMEVSAQFIRWPEQDQRTTRWFTPEAAAKAVSEAGLAQIIRAFAEKFAKTPS